MVAWPGALKRLIKMSTPFAVCLMRLVLENHYDKVATHLCDTKIGNPPLLHHMALNAHYKMFELMLARGADINEQDAQGYTALHFAVQGGWSQNVALLLKHDADTTVG